MVVSADFQFIIHDINTIVYDRNVISNNYQFI